MLHPEPKRSLSLGRIRLYRARRADSYRARRADSYRARRAHSYGSRRAVAFESIPNVSLLESLGFLFRRAPLRRLKGIFVRKLSLDPIPTNPSTCLSYAHGYAWTTETAQRGRSYRSDVLE